MAMQISSDLLFSGESQDLTPPWMCCQFRDFGCVPVKFPTHQMGVSEVMGVPPNHPIKITYRWDFPLIVNIPFGPGNP